jgi:putative flippase GtrA
MVANYEFVILFETKCMHILKNNEFVRFIGIGIINTLFAYMLFILFITLEMHYIFAVLFSTIIGVLFSFTTFGNLVFKKNKKSFFRFILLYIFLYFINISIIGYIKTFYINNYIAGAISSTFCAFLSFLINKYYVFKVAKGKINSNIQ